VVAAVDDDPLFAQTEPLPRPPFITEMAGLEDVHELGSSRFGAVRLVRRARTDGTFEYFAAKFYNAGDNRDRGRAFSDLMQPFVDLHHPHVMPIVGMIAPTKGKGPIVLTPHSDLGSLEDVLARVRRNDPPPIWSDATKLWMILSLASGLIYLHFRGIVHRELKPTDLIVEKDGSLRICGSATSVLEEHKYARATQVGGPSYMAPEVYNDEAEGVKVRDPKTDVFSFGLILYELLCGGKVFASSLSAAAIMRRAMSARASDRPMIPASVPPVLREMIQRSWIPEPSRRPTMEWHWKRMRELGFRVIPGVTVSIARGPAGSGGPSPHASPPGAGGGGEVPWADRESGIGGHTALG
jgi:serine/threonine protein kinase